MRSIKVQLILAVFSIVGVLGADAQSSAVDHIWDGRLLNHTTTSMPAKGRNELYIIHYFGSITENGVKDLFGVYGSSNVQMGLERGLSENFAAFFLSEKMNKSQELGFRYRLVQQDFDNETPVSLALAFSVGIDGRDEKYFGENYFFSNRFFYSTQLSLTRQLNHRCEMMVNSTIAHFNSVPEERFSTFLSLNPSFAYKLNRTKALFASCDFPLGVASASEESPKQPSPLATLGIILKSPGRNMQIFVSNGRQIVPGKEYLNNTSGFDLSTFCIGFNMNMKLNKGH